jgi:hypothetical protein
VEPRHDACCDCHAVLPRGARYSKTYPS